MEKQVQAMFLETDLTIQEMGNVLDVPWWDVSKIINQSFTVEQRRARKSRTYRKSKLGEANPMFGKSGPAHHNFIGAVGDGNGYLMVLKPEWYTGRPGSKHVFQHSVELCKALGITEIPKGFVVHHLDGDRKNNAVSNLALMTTSAHMRLHSLERATTSRKT